MFDTQIFSGYQAALEGVAFYPIPAPGYLSLSGETRSDYLQRQTSNNIDFLTSSRALPTLLPSASGRVLEAFTLLEIGDRIAVLTQPGHAPGLTAYFQKRIFFGDQLSIADQSSDWLQVELHGPRAPEMLSKLGFRSASSMDEVSAAGWYGHDLLAIGEPGFGNALRFLLLAPSVLAARLTSGLAALGAQLMHLDERRALRVEAGAAGDPELNGEYTPFELGLDRLVSTEKGCYTGQEVLARQVTYDKVVRKLVQLQAGQPIESGASVDVDGRAIGLVTSAIVSPRLGALALAILRKPFDQRGTTVEIKQSQAFKATVI